MSEQQDLSSNDGLNDAWASVAVITLIVGVVVYWLSGMAT